MARIKANKASIIRWKIYIDRARMYIGYIQFLMVGFVFLKDYKETSFGDLIFGNMWISIPILFALFIVISLILGRIDTVYGLKEEEMRNLSNSNPMMREIQASLVEIKAELKNMQGSTSNSGSK